MLNIKNLLLIAGLAIFASFGLVAFGETANAPPPVSFDNNDTQIVSVLPSSQIEGEINLDQKYKVGDVIDNATIGEELSADDIDGLLTTVHGPKNINKYPTCNRCRAIRCNASGSCSGHCKRRGRLFNCNTTNSGQS